MPPCGLLVDGEHVVLRKACHHCQATLGQALPGDDAPRRIVELIGWQHRNAGVILESMGAHQWRLRNAGPAIGTAQQHLAGAVEQRQKIVATETGLGAEVGQEGGIGHEHHQTIEATIARIQPSRQQQAG